MLPFSPTPPPPLPLPLPLFFLRLLLVQVLRDTGIETPGNAIFRMIGKAPIRPMVAGFAEIDTQEEEEEEGQEGSSKTRGQMESAKKPPRAEEV